MFCVYSGASEETITSTAAAEIKKSPKKAPEKGKKDIEGDGLEAAAKVEQTRTWIISQLCSVSQAQSCSKATAIEVLQFLTTVAFVEIGPKGAKSKLAPVKLLAASEGEFSEELRNFAAARVASLATDRLPCATVEPAKQSKDADGETEPQVGQAKDESQAGKPKDKKKRKQQSKQQHQAHACLVDEV
jgi:hypothetical protein